MVVFEPSIVKLVGRAGDYRVRRCSLAMAFRTFCSTLNEQKKITADTSTEKLDSEKQLQKKNEYYSIKTLNSPLYVPPAAPQIWNENRAIKKIFRENNFFNRMNDLNDFNREMADLHNFLTCLSMTNIKHWLKEKVLRHELLKQQYLPERAQVLKPDLAAAHFIISRGGSVKFSNNDLWIGKKQASKFLPFQYTPGYKVIGINAEGTKLRREGLENLADISELKWLSLRGLLNMDDWCLDWLSNQFQELEYLDISGCINITYRGLSCFYRFKSLKTLIAEGVSDTPEFKVACLMVQDVLPELMIGGINLEIPEKIDSLEDQQQISDNRKSVEIRK